MTRFFLYIITIYTVLSATSCIQFSNQYTKLAPGVWRGVLQLDPHNQPLKLNSTKLDADPNAAFEEVSGGELPFLFEVVYDTKEQFHLEIINGTERIRVDDIVTGRNKRTGRDTIRITFTEFNTYITGAYEGGVMEGRWVKGDKQIPFVAKYGQNYRFTTLAKTPTADISGKWETTFGIEQEKAEEQEKAIGEFQQKGNKLTGTFLTETGDYRFLDGEVQANKFYLSCFDGAHAFLFEGKILENQTLFGSFRSGMTHRSQWESKRNDAFQLRDEYSISQVKKGQESISLNLTNPDGKSVSLQSADYQGKVKILQVSGTWCPNCWDESKFLAEYVKTNPDLKVIGLFFEKSKDKEIANAQLKRYSAKMNLPYETVVAGYADKNEAAAALPMLDKIAAFPTTIFIDKNNKIRRVHTGFTGPATSEYPRFKKEFDELVKQLQAEGK